MDEKTVRELFGWFPPERSPNFRKITAGGTEYLDIVIPIGGFLTHACIPLTGRPDMSRPHGHETFLQYLRSRAAKYTAEHGTDEGFELSDDDLEEIAAEIMDLYRRRRFLLEGAAGAREFEVVVRDGNHAIELMDMLEKYSPDREGLQNHRKYEPYIRSHITQAQALLRMQEEDYGGLARAVKEGIAAIQKFDEEHEPWQYSDIHESTYPQSLIGHLKKMAAELLQGGQDAAVEQERYEAAGVIRDLLAEFKDESQDTE